MVYAMSYLALFRLDQAEYRLCHGMVYAMSYLALFRLYQAEYRLCHGMVYAMLWHGICYVLPCFVSSGSG